MANKEHLMILEQGVEVWNKWRDENPDIQPDLSKIHTSLSYPKINFNGANLSHAIFDIGFFFEADFSNANLHKASFHGSLRDTNFHNANLLDAVLTYADIRDSNMEKTNLKNADIRYSRLIRADFTGAVLTGTRLYGTARDGWIIKNVECKYVYWDEPGKQRSPKDRNLGPREFERIYSFLPTIEYVFEQGISPIDPLIMDRVVQAIREKQPEFDIKIDSISARGLAPSIKFTVQHERQKKSALAKVRKEYEKRIEHLETEKDQLYELLGQAIDKSGIKLITASPGSIVAIDGSTVHIEQHVNHALELQKSIAEEPKESKNFANVAKRTALDLIGNTIKDIAKGQIKEAAKQIIELGKDLGPIITKTAAYVYFQNIVS